MVNKEYSSSLCSTTEVKTEPVPLEFIETLQSLISELARTLHAEPMAIQPPLRGLLSTPLSDHEKEEINKCLAPVYAAESVNFQDKVSALPIVECGEKMVSLSQLFNKYNVRAYFSSIPFHPACGEWGGRSRIYWVREQVAQRLLQATVALNQVGLTFKFQDAFRPAGVQEGLFKRRITEFIMPKYPDWNWEQILLEAKSKTAINPRLSGHKSGAAVDTTLCSLDGVSLPLGNEYPEGGAMVALDFPYLTKEQWATRQLFANIMRMVELTPYSGEDWHASFGDILSRGMEDCHVNAIYGPIKTFNSKTGDIVPYDPGEYDKPFYTKSELLNIVPS